MAEQYIVSAGISGGEWWATYTRRPSGGLRRVKSPKLPLRATRAEAERDLCDWLSYRVHLDPRTTAAERAGLAEQLRGMGG